MNKINWDTYHWTHDVLIAVRAIRLIEMKMEPDCEECGCGANRPNCANDMGGYCQRHNQSNVVAFREVIEELEKTAGLNTMYGWRGHYPIDEIRPINEENKALLHDLYDIVKAGGKHATRKMDERYRYLADIGAVYYSASERWYVTFTKRGEALAEKLFGEA